MKTTLTLWSVKTSKGYPIKILTGDKGKHKYESTNIFIEKNDWNNKSKEIRKTHPDHLNLNKKLQELLHIKKTEGEINPFGIVQYIKDQCNYLEKTKHFGNYRRFKTLEKSISSFIVDIYGKNDILWSELNQEFLKKWIEYIQKDKKLQSSTLKNYVKRLKSLFYTAQTEKKHNVSNDIFDVVRFKENEVRHKALSLVEINKLFNCEDYSITSNKGIQLSILIFKFQFYTSMRIGDVLTLKWSNIRNSSIVYRMMKTNQDHVIPISKPVADILISLLPKEFKHFFKLKFDKPTDTLKYLSKLNFTTISDKFVFPMLDEATDINSMKGYKSIISKTSLVNNNLKKAGKVLGLRISSHTARHSIASAMLHSKEVDLMTIKQLLNHSSLQITEKYLSKLTLEQYENNVTDFINKM